MLQAELRKLRTTRAYLGLLAGAVAVVALSAFSTTTSADVASLRQPLHEQQVFLLASINVGLFGLILGIRSFTDEFRHDTLAWTLLGVRRRPHVILAKGAVTAGAALVLAMVSQAVMVVVAALFAATKGASLGFTGADATAVVGLAGATAAWAVIGVAVGALVRHQVLAVVGAVVWVLVIENLASVLLGDAGRFLPGQAAHAVANATVAGDLLPVGAGVAVLVAYACLSSLIAMFAINRRELSA